MVDGQQEQGTFVLGIVLAIGFATYEYNRADDAQKKLEVAQGQIQELKAKTATLTTASDSLKEQMERFQTESWRDVMSDAQSAADDVDSAKEDLKSAADEAEDS